MLELETLAKNAPHPDLPRAIEELSRLRQTLPALKYGDYSQLYIGPGQLVFSRQSEGQQVVVAVNTSPAPLTLELELPGNEGGWLVDRLNKGAIFEVKGGKTRLDPVWGAWARIMEYTPD